MQFEKQKVWMQHL